MLLLVLGLGFPNLGLATIFAFFIQLQWYFFIAIYGWIQKNSKFFPCECPFPRCSLGVPVSSMVDQFTKGQLFSGNWPKGEPNLPLNQKNRPGNVYRKLLKFPENPGNLNWWNCNIILMTINEAHLVAIRATITLTYIPVMTPGLYDTFPAHPDTFPGHIGWFPGLFLVEIWTF